ncbi:MAG: hypothetical protein DWQ10_10240, partial [Calditrichaeota bacterium]
MMKRFNSILFLLFLPTLVFAGKKELVSIDNIYPQEVRVQGFTLPQQTQVEITAVGAYQKSRSNSVIFGYGWIINADSRELVWEMKSERIRSRHVKPDLQHDEITLEKGSYEVYYSSYPYYRSFNKWDYDEDYSLGKFIMGIIKGFDFDDWDDHNFDRLCEKFKIVVVGDGEPLAKDDLRRMAEKRAEAEIVHLFANRDDDYLEQGFELTRDTKIDISAYGEMREDGRYDYGWIINADSRKKVWQMEFWDSQEAGGARKNRAVNETINLPAGRYAAIFVTDDSHSAEEWNSPPPFDPLSWGMRIRPADRSKRAAIKKFDYSKVAEQQTVVSLSKVRDNEYLEQAFRIEKPGLFRIYAVGEGRAGEMFDFGWILDAKTHKRIWEMHYDETEHAGGARKNRMFDDVIELEAGDYIACYQTDGTHAYGEWNATRPHDARSWGLTVFIADKNLSRHDVEKIDMPVDENVIAKIWRVRDHAHKQVRFELDKNTEVRIYAIGEGDRGEMFDYAWIEKDNGRTAWEMR